MTSYKILVGLVIPPRRQSLTEVETVSAAAIVFMEIDLSMIMDQAIFLLLPLKPNNLFMNDVCSVSTPVPLIGVDYLFNARALIALRGSLIRNCPLIRMK